MTIHTTIRLFLLLTFLRAFGAGMIFPVYVPYLLHNGLTIFEVSLVNSVFFWGQFLFEIPTGILADKFGRRGSVLTAWMMNSISMLLFGFSGSMPWFMAAELIDAVGCTFASGAFDAWITDQLRSLGHSERMSKLFAKSRFIEALAICVGAPIGALLLQWSPQAPWILSACATFTATGVASYMMHEDLGYRANAHDMGTPVHPADSMLGALRWSLQNTQLKYMFIVTTVFTAAIAVPNIQWVPLVQEALGGEQWNGAFYVAITLCIMFGLKVVVPRALVFAGSDEHALRLLYSSTGVVITAIGVALWFLDGWLCTVMSIGGFLAHEACRGAIAPLRDGFYSHHFPPKYRATLLSIASLSHHIGGGVGLLCFGLIGSYSAAAAWLIAGTLLAGIALRVPIQK